MVEPLTLVTEWSEHHPQDKFSSIQSLSRVWLFVTSWTGAYQAPPSMGFSRQEDCSGRHCLLHRKVASHVNFVLLATELSCWNSSLLLWLIFNTLIIQIDWTTLRKWQVKIFSLKTKALPSCPMWIELQIQTTDSSMQWFIFWGGGCCGLLVLICFEELEQY